MPRGIVLVLWAALVVAAALSTEGGGSSASGAVNAYVQRLVLPTEAGDLFYFASEGQAGAVNAFGQVLWSVRGELVASDPMGSCLAVASALRNGTVFLGTSVALYTPDGRPLWNATVNVAATALATNCVAVAGGGIDGSLYTLRDGRVVGVQRHGSPIYALAYKLTGRWRWAPATRSTASPPMWIGAATPSQPSRQTRRTSWSTRPGSAC